MEHKEQAKTPKVMSCLPNLDKACNLSCLANPRNAFNKNNFSGTGIICYILNGKLLALTQCCLNFSSFRKVGYLLLMSKCRYLRL